MQRLAKAATSDSAIIFAGIAIFFAAACAIGVRLDIWGDEAYTLHTTGAGVARSIHRAIFFELQPPLYFLLLALWREINSSDFFARFFSIAAATATIPIAAVFAKRHISKASATLAAIVVAFNPFLLFVAEDIRVYALITFLSALLTLFLFEAYLGESPAGSFRGAYIVTAVAALYTQYYLGFLLVAGAAAVLVFRRKRARVYVLDMLLVGLAALPILGFLHVQLAQELAGSYHVRTATEQRAFASSLIEFVVPFHWIDQTSKRVIAYAAIPCLAILALWFGGSRFPRPRTSVMPRLALFAGTAIACFAAAIARFPGTFGFPRHITSVFIPCEMLLIALVAAAPAALQKRVAAFVVVAALGVGYATDAPRYRDFESPGYWREVAHFLERHARAGEAIFVYDGEQTLPFLHEFHADNPVIGIPGPPRLDRYNPQVDARIDRAALRNVIRRRLASDGSVWIVATSGQGPYYEAGAAKVAAVVASSFQIVERTTIGGTSVERVRLRQARARRRRGADDNLK